MDDFLTVSELSKRWKVSTRHVHRLQESADIKATWIGGRKVFGRDEIERYEIENTEE